MFYEISKQSMTLWEALKYQSLIIRSYIFFAKPSSLCQRGPSYWNLNEEILNNNASLIRKDLKKLIETESPIIYENFK